MVWLYLYGLLFGGIVNKLTGLFTNEINGIWFTILVFIGATILTPFSKIKFSKPASALARRDNMKCSQCGYENKEAFSRCPRCYKVVALPKDCASCGSGIFKIKGNC